MEISKLLSDYSKIVEFANSCVKNEKLEEACHYLQCAGRIAWRLCPTFEDLSVEQVIKDISKALFPTDIQIAVEESQKKLLFIDTMCADVRGLGFIYLDALLKVGYQIDYVYLKSKEKSIQHTLNYLSKSGKSTILSINDSSLVDGIIELANIIERGNSNITIVNCNDNDIIPCVAIYHFSNMHSYRISYGDHTFNLGTSIYEYLLEYRDVGVYISRHFRNKSENKIIKLPIFPNQIPEKGFRGFPFDLNGKRLILSGGQIYKTIDSNNTFYKIIRKVLTNHPDCFFCMLSNGSTPELEKLLRDFPQNAYHLKERDDLNEILKRSTIYISTYPILGGLMMQYAALNKRIPITLVKDKQLQSGFLLQEEKINCCFEKEEELLNEIDRLLEDNKYLKRKEKLLVGQTITADRFKQILDDILAGEGKGELVNDCPVTIEQVQGFVRSTLIGIEKYLPYIGAHPKEDYKYMVRLYPFKATVGLVYRVVLKIIGK